MGLVQFVIVLVLSAHLVVSSPLTQIYAAGDRKCKMCPAGEYQKSCAECAACPDGSYTTEDNLEDNCHPCFSDCRTGLNLKMVQNCTRTSDLKCVCEAGFRCINNVPFSENCRECEKLQETTTTEAAAVTSGKDKHRTSSASLRPRSTSAKPCKLPKCGPQSLQPTANDTHLKTDKTYNQLAAIVCSMVAFGCVALLILLCVCRAGGESCFKQAIAKLYNEGGRDASHKPKESTHQFPRDSFSAKQQPSSLSAANLGPVHVNNPGTVIFSLLSQFTGQVGPTVEGGKTAKRGSSVEDRDCPVFHPTSSPSIHLSEEERSGEIDSIFFPSQEQGKDYHVSKEEGLKL